jgi:anti-sigma factor RsiW
VKSNLTCEDCRTELAAYLDGALVPAVARVIGQHVEDCPRCLATLETYRSIAERIAALPELSPPTWMEERIVRRALGARYLWTGWRRIGAVAAALSFAGGVGAIASLPRLLAWEPAARALTSLLNGLGPFFSGVAALPKQFALDVAFYKPIVQQVWTGLTALGHLPKAAFLLLRQPEAQAAGAIALFLGLALYFVLRPSRSHERGVGHACFSL